MNKESFGAFEGATIAPTPAPYDPTGKITGAAPAVLDMGTYTEEAIEVAVANFDAVVADAQAAAKAETEIVHEEADEPEEVPAIELEPAPQPKRKGKAAQADDEAE